MNKRITVIAVFCIFFLLALSAIGASELLRPFMMAPSKGNDLGAAVENVRKALESGGLEIVGDYTPYEGAHIFVVSTEAARTAASRSETGGYGAASNVDFDRRGCRTDVANRS